jgi:hypothetical protein
MIEILGIIITTTGVLGAAVLPSYISNRKKTQEVSDKATDVSNKIGEPNGHGSIVGMLEEILGMLRDHGHRIDRLETKVDEFHGREQFN